MSSIPQEVISDNVMHFSIFLHLFVRSKLPQKLLYVPLEKSEQMEFYEWSDFIDMQQFGAVNKGWCRFAESGSILSLHWGFSKREKGVAHPFCKYPDEIPHVLLTTGT